MKKVKKILILIFISIICSCKVINERITSNINKIIFIDPGHGGKDNGTSYNDIYEDELNLKLSFILYEILLTENYQCYLTRVNDYDLSSTYAKNHKIEDLKKRVEYINNFHTDLLISLHLNYYPSSNVNGIQVFYKTNDENSYNIANELQNKLNELNTKSKKIKKGNFYILNNINNSGVLIEYGFLSNDYDRLKLQDKKYLTKLAITIKDGIKQCIK